MKKRMALGILTVLSTVIFIQSCEVNRCSYADMVSGTDGDESKKMKGNCMNCHGPNGSGKGCFIIAGTVYDSTQTVVNSDAVMMFYTQPNGGGQLVATLDVDRSGNFYTTALINFSNGLYPAIVSKISGKVSYMPTSTVSGACGSCHGVTNARIWIN